MTQSRLPHLNGLPFAPQQAQAIQVQAQLEEAKLRCQMLGCSEEDIDRHQKVVLEIAVSQLLFGNNAVYQAGLDLLYRNLAAGRSPFPTISETDGNQLAIADWGRMLWDIVSGDEGRDLLARLAHLRSEYYVAWLHTVEQCWAQRLEGSA